jgi:hypothetical protein
MPSPIDLVCAKATMLILQNEGKLMVITWEYPALIYSHGVHENFPKRWIIQNDI